MRKDSKIFSVLDEFIFIGYSVRGYEFYLQGQHKPDCYIITADFLHPPDSEFLERIAPDEKLKPRDHPFEMITSLEGIKKVVYGGLDKEFPVTSIFGLALELERILKFKRTRSIDDGVETAYSFYKYLYAFNYIIEEYGELRGFDVIDANLWISAITNCGIDWTIIEESGELNKYHLFNNYADALKFRSVADELVEEHSPFAVLAICEIEIQE